MNTDPPKEKSPRAELSARKARLSDDEWSVKRLSLVEEYIADRRQFRKFRNYAFFGMVGLIVTLVAMFALWVRSFGLRVFSESLRADQPQAILLLMPLVVIASLVAVALLPLVRLVFRETGDKEDNKDSLTIWQTLVKELADLLKQYVGRSRPTT
ncbi:hypothetical protein [Burkholderia sp. THE68]|uniref:hypothetical protein n=1 Tax=Burkholderia sp. THE68 TaxID=758782 RepID=UPI0013894F1D|nr:hypothetical protein [Burkholderia sp. THE68]